MQTNRLGGKPSATSVASEVQIFLFQQLMRRTAIGLTSWQLVVIGSNPIRSDKCRSLAQSGLEHKYLKKPHKMLGWTSWLSHKIFILAFRSSNLLPSTKKCCISQVGKASLSQGEDSLVRAQHAVQMRQQLSWLEHLPSKQRVDGSNPFYRSNINAVVAQLVRALASQAEG